MRWGQGEVLHLSCEHHRLAVAVALGGVMPLPYGAASAIQDYVAGNHAAAVAIAVGTFGSSIPLAIYAATASARLRQLGITAPGATIALAGGLLASAGLALSGLMAGRCHGRRSPRTSPRCARCTTSRT